nr:MAG TPA: hypothetical protein [Caudoviricetes sp.]
MQIRTYVRFFSIIIAPHFQRFNGIHKYLNGREFVWLS